jgi:cell division protein FtsB
MTGKHFWSVTFPVLRNKYAITILVFIVWILFFDQNNLMNRFSSIKKLKKLEKEKIYYKNKIQEDQKRIKELTSDKNDLEKFAREKYLMKKDNEDIFVIIERNK